MYRFQIALCLLFICCSLMEAQSKPDFSGVFVMTQESSTIVRPMLVLEIKQTADRLAITLSRNGESVTRNYSLTGSTSSNPAFGAGISHDRIRFKDKKLIIESKLDVRSMTPPLDVTAWTASPLAIKDTWELSRDNQTLLVRRDFDRNSPALSASQKETFSRRTSLESALAEAKNASEPRCTEGAPVQQEGPLKYDSGAIIGNATYWQVTHCAMFTADLSGDFFKHLERRHTPRGDEFHEKGQPTLVYPDFVTLEIEPFVGSCGWPLYAARQSQIPPPATSLPPDFRELRFHIRWAGATTKDLGEMPANLLRESWTELDTPREFYRLNVPSQDVPLSDVLQIEILAKSGEPLACISGHI